MRVEKSFQETLDTPALQVLPAAPIGPTHGSWFSPKMAGGKAREREYVIPASEWAALRSAMGQIEAILSRVQIRAPRDCPNCVEVLLQCVADHFEVPIKSILGGRREQWIVWPRHCAIALVTEFAKTRLSATARIFKKDHTTVIFALRNVQARCETEERCKQDMKSLRMMASRRIKK